MFAHFLVNGIHLGNIKVQTAAGDVTLGNEGACIVNKDSGAATAVTLPPNPGANGTMKAVWVVDGKGDAASNNITVAAATGNINGSASYVISENYGAVLFLYNGTQWNVAGTYKANATVAAQTITTLTVTTANVTTVDATTTTTDFLNFGVVSTVAATGTVIANAASITNSVTIVTGADDAKGVVLPTAVAGKVFAVYSNQATNGLKVYPPVNGTINDGSANAAVVIEGKSLALFLGTNSTNWASIFTTNS